MTTTVDTQTQTYYRSNITAVGDEAKDLIAGGVLILFSPPCPPALSDVSVLHQAVEPLARPPRAGDVLKMGEQSARLISVGEIAGDNLQKLGHVVVYFNKAEGEKTLPGALHIAGTFATPAAGAVIELQGPETADPS